MKRLVILFLFSVILSNNVSAQDPVRERLSFNENWTFTRGDDVTYCEKHFNDADWRRIDVPHDWSVENDFSKENSGRNAWLPGGIGWYRKVFELPAWFRGKAIEIQFDGVYKNASVWVNQHPVGTQHDGYTSFRYDITELLTFEGTNTIAVRVDNSIQPNCRWYSGSGIYRNVWLNVTSPTHVETWGTFITTPEVSKDRARVKIVTEIVNQDEAQSLHLETLILDAAGHEVAKTSSDLTVERYSRREITQQVNVESPRLWSLAQPVLYQARSTIKREGQVLDTYTSTFGIRTIVFDAERGFFLNGKNMKMKGVCLHHDAGPLGAAVPDAVWLRRLRALKALGCNAIRTAHNPPSVEFLDLCDSLGFLVMNEFVDKWENPYKRKGSGKNPFYDVPFADPHFCTEWEKIFRETIRRDRNHPSVIMWSVGNENHPPATMGQNNGLRKYTSFVRSMDATRPVISGMERGKDKPVSQKVDDIIESCTYMDLIALNYGEQWCTLLGERKPGKPFVSTESYTYFNSALEKRFANIERSPWIDVIENEHNMGLYLWVGIDYLGESRRWGSLGSGSGLLDMAGFRKNQSFLYEAFWSEQPVVHLGVYQGKADDFSTSGRWGWPPMDQSWNRSSGDVVDLVSYTNCEEVDLFLNGKKLGTQKLADFPNWIMTWRHVTHEPGVLKAVGKNGGQVVCATQLITAGKPQRIKLAADVQHVSPGDIVHVEVCLVDEQGNTVSHDDRRIHFKLDGEDSEILAVTNGSMRCLESFTNKQSRPTQKGRCLSILRVGAAVDQKLTVFVEGEGLDSASLTLPVIK